MRIRNYVFPAQAGVSLLQVNLDNVADRLPRASGGEPDPMQAIIGLHKSSPRKRG